MPIVVSTGRTAFEVPMLGAALVAGTTLVIVDMRPRSVAESMPPAVQDTWEVALIVAGLVGLIGAYWPGRLPTGLGAEMFAVIVLGTSTTMYAIALAAISGWEALAAGSFIAAVGVASWWRCAEIVRDLRRLVRAGREEPR